MILLLIQLKTILQWLENASTHIGEQNWERLPHSRFTDRQIMECYPLSQHFMHITT